MDLMWHKGVTAFWRRGGLFIPLALALWGCGKEGVQVYEIPKEQASKPVVAQGGPHGDPHGGMMPAMPRLEWKTPEGWSVEPSSGIRVADFRVKGQDGEGADVSVIPLAKVTASRADIVNLWRTQVGLPPATEADLPGMMEPVKIGEESGEMFDMVSEQATGGHKTRILVAMVTAEEHTWFFKMTGADELVAREKPKFVDFLKSARFLPPAAAPAMATAASAPAASAGGGGRPSWTAPESWEEQPPTSMGLARFAVSGQGAGQAEVTVTVIPGTGGGLGPNVNRWRRQLGLGPASEAEMKKLLVPLSLKDGDGTLVDMTGGGEQARRMIGAIVGRAGQTWFYKMTGDVPVVGAEKERFVKFVESVNYGHAN